MTDRNYAVRVWMNNGKPEPEDETELDWFSLGVAKKIASKLFEARERVVNSPVTAIEIVDENYLTKIIHRFTDPEEDEDV